MSTVNGNPERPVLFTGLDDALIGIATRACMAPRACYDEEKIISVLISQGMTEEDAIDYASFNIFCLYAGEGTPLILSRMTPQEAKDVLSELG